MSNNTTATREKTIDAVEKAVAEKKPKLADVERTMKNRQIQQKFQEYLPQI